MIISGWLKFLVRNNTIVMKSVHRQNDGTKLKSFLFVFTFYSTLEYTNPVYVCAEHVAICVDLTFCLRSVWYWPSVFLFFYYLPALQFFIHIWIIGLRDDAYFFFIREWIPGKLHFRKWLIGWFTKFILVSSYRIPFLTWNNIQIT